MPSVAHTISAERAFACVTTLTANWNWPSERLKLETTERYPGCKQQFRNAENYRIGIEPE